ncbi:hypothetical protein ACFXDI_47470, partial [Streptomyces mirabilis]
MTVTKTAEARTVVPPEIADPSQVAPKDARQLSRLFFDRLAVLEEGTREYQYVRDTLIELTSPPAEAGGFFPRGLSFLLLRQQLPRTNGK